MGSLKYGVSVYSYVNDYASVMTLEDAFDHIADTGATGIEILGEGQIEGYPEPSSAWLEPVVRPCRSLQARAHEHVLVDRHPHHADPQSHHRGRRGGTRAGLASGRPARLQVPPPQVRRHLARA
jgi:hypothetical protein